MKKVCLLSLASLFTLLAANAQADGVKLAVVDMQSILQKAPQIAKINDSLTKQFKGRQDQIVQAQHNLQNETQNLEKNAAVMKVDERANLEKKIMMDRNNVQSMVASFQKDLSKQQSDSLHGFSQQLDSVVSKLASQTGLDLVVQKGSTLYAKSDLDITQQVLDALRKA
ncbi:OmpH family outer membrane protein [Rickettsiella endosymbiont of Dermanyssus gallinae]|uniref:OmpH family outer membrane protein n=1 Tax=Rickettsiella endosymbiont of Dermanyssus gallinae TaxID=2856608 RepID=UPI001C531D75|nr:OmpH family outer membrane protein [Rickettsiella endosymbiont of Dermanyssus gallinae]